MSGLMMSSLFVATPVAAEEEETDSCFLLCTPELNLEPTLSIGNLIAAPRIEDVATGQSRRLVADPVFQVTLSLGIPTELPFVELTFETIVTPFGDDNALEFEAELNLIFLWKEWTDGWIGAHFDIIDQLSPRARPGGSSAYTHKLDLELDVAFYVFNWLPPPNWLRHVSAEASFDYLATGLPRQGDVIDGERYLDDATGWSLSLLIVVPLAPIERS
ncbi:MAG: hypothetical protein RMA76_05030 [Deltaproteobacteria bacterium]